MTCVAAKDGIMAADGQLHDGAVISTAVKIVRLPDGGVAGAAGVWSEAYRALVWLANGEQGPVPQVGDETSVLILRGDGTLWFVDQGFPGYPITANEAAIGGGAQAALAAMKLGQSAEQAVKLASEICPGVGPPFSVLSIQQPKPRKKKAR